MSKENGIDDLPVIEKDDNEITLEKELFKTHEIEGSPIMVIEDLAEDVPRYFGVVGNHRVTEFYDNMTDVVDKVQRPEWQTIMAVISTMIENADLITNLNDNNE